MTNGPVVLDYGTIQASEVNNKQTSKTISFKCNSHLSMPKITLSRTNIPVCDRVSINLAANSNRGGGDDIITSFESTLKVSGEIDSSCAKSFSESVIATITPP